MPKLFVYGTLQRGLQLNWYLAGQEFKRLAYTLPLYRLYSVEGYFPALVRVIEGGRAIRGELWEIDGELFNSLDKVESAYNREKIELDGGDWAHAYLWWNDTSFLWDAGDRWPDEQELTAQEYLNNPGAGADGYDEYLTGGGNYFA